MKLLLINKNPVVSRMINMSASKAGFEVEEISNVNDLEPGEYDVVFLDDEMYDENFLGQIKQNIKFYQIGLITASKEIENENLDFILPKPFLPTDLLEMLRKVEEKIAFEKEQKDRVDESLESKETNEEPKEEVEPEKIVEIEEREEESPFIEPMDKSGVLDENELVKVTNLLEDESVPEQELQEESESSNDEEEKSEGIVQLSESEEIRDEEENLQSNEEEEAELTTDEATQSSQTTSEEFEEVSEEHSEEQPAQLLEESVEEEKSEVEKEHPLPQESLSPSPTKLIDTMKQNLTISNLQDLLDGMQIDITIKISYPDRNDV